MNKNIILSILATLICLSSFAQNSLLIVNSNETTLLNATIFRSIEALRDKDHNFLFNEIKFLNDFNFVEDFSNLMIQHIEKTSNDRFVEYRIDSNESLDEFKRMSKFNYILFIKKTQTPNPNIMEVQFWVYDCENMLTIKEEESKIVFEAKSAINTASFLYNIGQSELVGIKNIFESLFFILSNKYKVEYQSNPLKIVGNKVFLKKNTGLKVEIKSENMNEDLVTWKLFVKNGKIINSLGSMVNITNDEVYKFAWQYKNDTSLISTTYIEWVEMMKFSRINSSYPYYLKRGLFDKDSVVIDIPLNISNSGNLVHFKLTTCGGCGDLKLRMPKNNTNQILKEKNIRLLADTDKRHHPKQKIQFEIYDKNNIKHDSILIKTPIYHYSPLTFNVGFANNESSRNLLFENTKIGPFNMGIGPQYFVYDFAYVGIFFSQGGQSLESLIDKNIDNDLLILWSSLVSGQFGYCLDARGKGGVPGFSLNLYYGLNKVNLLTKFGNIAFLTFDTKWNNKVGFLLRQRLKFFYGNGLSLFFGMEHNFVNFDKTITNIKIQQGLLKEIKGTLPTTYRFGVSLDAFRF